MSFKSVMLAVSLVVPLGTAAGAGPASAQSGHEGHGAHAAATAPGALLRESKVQGYVLEYRLLSWEERTASMKGMEGHEMAGMDNSGRSTHHLMLFVTGPDGKQLAGGKVGFILTGPDAKEFKTLTMAMGGGYGADVPLKPAGVYTFKTKAVFGDRTLTEEFTHTVK